MTDQQAPPDQSAALPQSEREYLTLPEFLKEAQISYSTYRTLRAKGKTPKELRLSRRTIRISRAAMTEWRHNNELHPAGQSTL